MELKELYEVYGKLMVAKEINDGQIMATKQQLQEQLNKSTPPTKQPEKKYDKEKV